MTLHEALHGVKSVTIREVIKKASQEILLRPIELFQYFLESQECYRVDRDLMIKSAMAKPRKSTLAAPRERQQQRERRLEEFGAMALRLIKTELELLPLAERPSIPAFSMIGSKMTFDV